MLDALKIISFLSSFNLSRALGITARRGLVSKYLETCEYSRTHSIVLENGSGTLRGRVSLDLPIKGKGYLESDSIINAQNEAEELVQSANKTITWKIKIEDGGQIASSEGVVVESEFSSHELLELEKFKLNPVHSSTAICIP